MVSVRMCFQVKSLMEFLVASDCGANECYSGEEQIAGNFYSESTKDSLTSNNTMMTMSTKTKMMPKMAEDYPRVLSSAQSFYYSSYSSEFSWRLPSVLYSSYCTIIIIYIISSSYNCSSGLHFANTGRERALILCFFQGQAGNLIIYFRNMINIRLLPQQPSESDPSKFTRKPPKLPRHHQSSSQNQPFQNSPDIITGVKTESLRASTGNPPEDEEKPRTTFKLPQIHKKTSENFTENTDVNEKDNETLGEEPKTIQSNPFVRKYTEFKSTQKIKSEEGVNFLNIVGFKPAARSSSRMSGKEKNTSLAYDKIEKGKFDRPLPLKEDSNTSNTQGESSPLQTKPKKRRISTNVNLKSTSTQKVEIVSRPKKNSTGSAEKKKSTILLKLQKPKQPPSYYQWCLFLGLLDGVVSQKESAPTYKAFVGKGNNSILIKNVIKSRPWWTLAQQNAEVNLLWTQMKNAKFLQSLKQGQAHPPLDWQKVAKGRMYLLGQTQNLNDKTKDRLGSGFHKILTASERDIFTKSPLMASIYYPSEYRTFDSTKIKSHNHLQFHWNLSNKKALYYNMKAYYEATGKNSFDHIPETYHVQKEGDEEWKSFVSNYSPKSLWIIKPGQNSNQGCGIDVVETVDEVKQIIRNKSTRANGKPRSHIIQRYLMPFLYNKRKFDIRCYVLVTSLNGNLRCYWYEEGYIRTASKEFTTKNLKNRMIHLTNDTVQKHSQNYGKHQNANKLSFSDFSKYVKNVRPDHDFYDECYPRMVELAADSLRASHLTIDAKHREFSFQVFGLDYMIDEHFNTWLIEVNTNPCLELSCPLLARLVPSMLQNSFRVAVDPIFPPPKDYPKHKGLPQDFFETNKFSLIFSSREETDLSQVLQPSRLQDIVESDEESEVDEKEQ